MFITTFCNFAVEEFADRLSVIHLTRNPRATARSCLFSGMIPKEEASWTPSPSAADNALPMKRELGEDGEFHHPYYRCLWYWYETEARIMRFARQHPTVRIVPIRTEDLNDSRRMAECLQESGVPADRLALEHRGGKKENSRPPRTERLDGVTSEKAGVFESECRSRLKRLYPEWGSLHDLEPDNGLTGDASGSAQAGAGRTLRTGDGTA